MNDGAPVPLDAKRQLAARLLRARQAVASAFPLSSGQRALLFLHEIEPEGSAYNVAFPIRLRGPVDLEALRRALQDVAHRHPMLRATFARRDGEPEQRISEQAVPLQHVDLTGATEAELLSAVQAAYREPFDLSRDPAFRAVILSVGVADHVLLPLAHHIVIDGQSILTILEDLGQAYQARRAGHEPAWPPLLHTYADFARWQQTMLEGADGERLWRFWQERLAGELPTLALPTDRLPPPRRSGNGGQVDFRLDADFLGQLKHTARRNRVTLNALLLSAYAMLLHRLSGQDDVLIGSIVSGRTRSEFDAVVGYFINTVVHRSRLDSDPSATQVMTATADLSAAAFAYQDFPFLQVVERLRIERNPSQTPVFQAAFNYRQLRDQQALDGLIVPGTKRTLWGGLPAEPFEFAQQLGQFDLALELFEAHGALLGNLKFNTDLFDRTTAERWVGHFRALLESISADASRPARRLPMVSPAEQQTVQAWQQGGVARYADGSCVQAGFAAQARRHRNAPALIHAGASISYDVLDHHANRLARRLMAQGVTPGSFVGVMVERSPELVIAILAVLKAGAVYVPLDRQMPAPRRAFILGDTGARLLLTERDVSDADGDGDGDGDGDDSDPGIVSNPHDLAYVIYTSGSTGAPKGVAVTHANILSLTSDPYWHAAGHETVLLHSTPAFDASTFELWMPLLHGHTIALAPPGQLSTAQLADAIATLRPTRSFITSALFALMAEERPDCFAGMREIMAGGEVVPPESLRRVLEASRVTASNVYGPTEATTFTTRRPLERAADVGSTVPLGRPIANRDCLVLDGRLEPVPIGVIGELYIAGTGLARGYLNQPALTAERFVAHPLGTPGERLYRTGDRVRWNPDGTLEFLGRADDQVKVRGFRIEPAEIEGALRQHPAIAASAVVAHDGASGKQLVAYLVIRDGEQMPTVAALRDHLGETLPAYMIPAAFMRLDALPLGRTGKIDRKSLPAPALGASDSLYRAPRNPTEELLTGVWGELLGQPRVGIDDNFFELGGHSLLATKVVSRLRTLMRREVPLRRLFERPTIASLAASLGGEETAAAPVVVPPRPTALPLSFAQGRLWFLDQFEASSAAYVIPMILELEGSLDAAALEHVLQSLVARHETLRTCFRLGESGLVQEIQPASAFRLQRSDGPVDAIVSALSHHRFDLARGLPIHATLIRLEAERHVLAMVVHHIAFDGWSVGIFFGELAALYAAARRGTPAALAPLPLGYADFALWHQALMADPTGPLAAELAFWRKTLDGAPAQLELPADLPRPAEPKRPAGFVPIRYAPEMLARWEGLARRQGVTLFMVLHAAFALVLSRWSGEQDVSIGTPIANRTRREFEGLIGFFVNTLVLRLKLDGAPTLGELFERVRETDLAAFAHQALPFEKLVEELQPERVLGVSPLFQAMLALQNASSAQTPDFDGLLTRMLPPQPGIAKFAVTFSLQSAIDGGLEGILEYDAEMFSAASMRRMAGHLETLLEAMCGAAADTPVDRLSMLTAAERQTLLHDWNATAVPVPQDATLVDLFEEAARLHPEHDAVLFEDQRLSYAELHARANRLAHHLIAQGFGHQTRIGVALSRSPELIVAILGVMKAGATYVPLDPAYPAERLAFMTRDADLAMVIDDVRLVRRPASEPDHPPRVAIDPLDLAYIIYTSGSTGLPKGVATHHRGIVNLARAQVAAFDIGSADRVLQFASPSFDASLSEVATALIQGAALVLASADALMPGPSLAALAERHRFSHVTLPPTALAVMDPRSLPDCRVLVVAGEACPGEIVAAWAPGRTFLNAYGPSEVTICASISAPLQGDGPPPIGTPIANTQVWLLDDRLEPVPVGVEGDLYVSGIGLARGYLNQPRQTAQSFIAHPFGAPGERLYRTGDRARWRADGMLEFLGRADRQVKVRGFRIEPGEIESALRRHAHVSDAAVIPQAHGPGMRLVAYLVPCESEKVPSVAALRDHLGASLPSFMVPALFVSIDALPLTPSGKVDRNALPAPEAAGGGSLYRAPRTPCETLLVDLWVKLLGREQVGLDDNFFELGGDSIVSIQMIAQARLGGWIVTPRQVFQNPTVAQLAAVAKSVAGGEAAVDGAETGRFAPTPIMRWLFERGDSIDTFSQHLQLRAPAGLTTPQLIVLLQALLDRHAALRMALVRDPVDGTPQLDVPPAGMLQTALLVRRCDISGLADDNRRRVIAEQIDTAQRRLSPATGILLQAVHFDAGSSTGLLSLVIHHLAVDGVSWRILQADIVEAWRQMSAGRQPSLPPVGTSFRHWAQLLAARARTPDIEAELPYWSRALGSRGAEARPTCAAVRELTIKLPASTTAAVLRAPTTYGARVHELLLAAFARAVSESRGGGPIALDVEGHGRSDEIADEVDLSRTVGWFTSLYPVSLDPDATANAALVDAIKQQLRAIPGEGLGFGLLRYLNRQAASQLAALHQPEIAFNYLGRFATPAESEWAIVPWLDADHKPALPPAHAIEVNAVTLDGPSGPELSATWSWAPDLVDENSVRTLANAWFSHLESLAQGAAARSSNSAAVETLSLSPLQEGLLFRSLYDPQATDVYVVQVELEFEGPLDTERLSRSVQGLLQRHPNLSARFAHEGLLRPVQIIAPDAIVPWRVVDVADADTVGLAYFRDEELARRFDLATPPLLRACLVRHSGRAVLILTAHHILLDGWSMPLLLRDLLALYAGEDDARGLPTVTPYRRYIDWLARQDRASALAAWQQALDGLEEPSLLAGPRPAPGGARDRIEVILPEATTAQIAASARSAGLTLNTLLQGAWAILLQSLTGSSDVVFGVTVAGRPPELRGANDMIGLLANTVPLRARLLPTPTVRAFLAELQDRQAELTPHHYVGLGEIQQRTGLGELFDTLLLFENYPIGDVAFPEVRGAKVTRVEGRDATHYPLTLVAMPGASLALRLDYRPDLVAPARMREIAALLPELLQRLADGLDRPLGALVLRWPDTKHVVERANSTARPLPDQLLVEAFAEQVARMPTAPALICGDEQITYAELRARAERIASRLIDQGIGRGDIVAVELPRSAELVAALLGVLQSGAAYLPLDPALPADRRAFMLADARPALVIGDSSLPARRPVTAHGATTHPLDLAYTIYTSGSTGTPKGVAVTHKALANFLAAMREVCPLRAGDRLLATTSIGFDIAGLELFLPLLSSATVVLATADEAQDPAAIARLVDRHGIGTMQATPTLWSLLAEATPGTLGKLDVLVGGEALQPALARILRRHARRVVNLYGPTETTIWSTAMALADDTVAIGGPIANTTVHVLDDRLEPAPIGVGGDLYIGGAGLARGYLGRPDLTADRFVADPFGPSGGRLYRTGDRVRWRADGVLEFIGRADDQVKIRGVRIEPAEVEAALLQDAAIAAAVVVARDGAQGRLLVAYLVMRDGALLPAIESIRSRLAQILPDAMIPTTFVQLDTLPRNRNGKLDRKALPVPVIATTGEGRRTPRSPAEKTLAALWAELLGQVEIGIDDNFFELGGDSIVSIRLVTRARQAGLALTPRQVFENPTVAALAAVAGAAARPSTPRSQPEGDTFPLAPLQQGLLLHDLDERSADAYRMQVALRLDGEIDRAVLRRAWALVFDRHEALRIAIVQGDRGPMQSARPGLRLPWHEIDWPGDVETFLAEDRRRGFDLAQGPLLRMTLLRLAPAAHVLVLTNQHLLIDGWSLSVLIGELCAAWQALASGEAPALPPVRPYRDYIAWLGTRDDTASAAFWRQHLASAPEPLRLDLGAVANDTGMATHAARLPSAVAGRLAAAARRHRVSQHTILQSAWGLLLAHHAGTDDVVFGSVFAGRPAELENVERMVGLFINTLPARLKFTASDKLGDWLGRQQVEQAHRQDHGFAGLSTIRRWAGLPAGEESFETLLVFENQPMERLASGSPPPGVAIAPLPVEAHTHYKLALAIVPGEEIELRFSFDRTRFTPSGVASLAARFTVLVEAISTAEAQAPVHRLSVMTPRERDSVLRDWNATTTALPTDATLVDLLEDAAREHPEREAILFEDQHLTHAELHARANLFAHHLIARGVSREALVGISLPRSPELIVALLGVMKTGAAYLPLDPTYPAERLAFMRRDAGLALVVDALESVRRPATEPDHPPAIRIDPLDLAYVIYTSGSTGRPKGTGVAHRGAVNLARAQTRMLDIGPGARVLQFASANFDASVWELLALASGATLVMAQDYDLSPGPPLAALAARHRVTHATLPPTALAAMDPASLPDCRVLVVAGEACPAELVAAWSPGRTMLNGYGPTEMTVAVSVSAPLEGSDRPPSIGGPIANTQAWVLDDRLEPVPPGVAGELYASGVGLARGYLGRPDLTAERFIAHPFGAPGERLYRTGDRARWRSDGTLDFLGRADRQIKLRGFRIEPGEIEAALRRHSALSAATVVARDALSGKRLVAYIVARNDTPMPTAAALREHLAATLPDHMIPAMFVDLPALPLTPNGKIDHAALPSPDSVETTTDYRPPRDAIEFALQQIWQEVLSLPSVGTTADFFELGGDSINALQVLARCHTAFDKKIRVRDILEGRTIERLAQAIRDGAAPQLGHLLTLQKGDDRAPVFCLHGATGSVYYALAIARHLPGRTIYGLQLPEHDAPFPASIVEQAAAYIAELRRVQPNGPYHLLGWSYGGFLAHEMACQLQAAGEDVATLALIDPFRSADGNDTLSRQQAEELLQQDGGLQGDLSLAEFDCLVANYVCAARLLSDFRPGRFAGRVVLFEALGSRSERTSFQWLRADAIESILLDGDHDAVVLDPHAATIARRLDTP